MPLRGSLPHRLWMAFRRQELSARRIRNAGPPPPPASITQFYRWLHDADPDILGRQISLYKGIEDGAGAIEAAVAAFVVAVVERRPARVAHIAEALASGYPPSDLDIAAARAARRLRARPGSRLAPEARALGRARCWDEMAEAARVALAPYPVEVVLKRPREERFERHARWTRLSAAAGRAHAVLFVHEGLGNQLFQYAAGLAYARRTGAQFHLDLDWYRRADSKRQFLLRELRMPIREANPWQLARAQARRHVEPRMGLDDLLLNGTGPMWMRGYWERPVYFAAIEPEIRRLYRPRDPEVAARARATVERARTGDGPVVAVHIRRGDRVRGRVSNAPGSTLPLAYYHDCVHRFPNGTNFLIFSDTLADLAWCRENLAAGNDAKFTFADGGEPIPDLFAIAAADHAILSAGTFSWWGGWLGDRPGRRVLVPDPVQSLGAGRAGGQPPLAALPGWEVVRFEPSERCFPRASVLDRAIART